MDVRCARILLLTFFVLAAPFPAAVRGAGTLAVGEVFALSPGLADDRRQIQPVAAFDGQGVFLAVWQQGENYHGGPTADILGVRIDASGRVLDDPPIPLVTARDSQERPMIAYSRGVFLVVWHDLRNGRDWAVYGARVRADGKVLDADGFLIVDEAGNQAMPVVAPAADGFLVVWQAVGRGGLYELHAASVGVGGEVRRHGALRHAPGAAGRWSGYTPGWGFGRLPVRTGDDDVLRGGEPSLIAVDGGWLLSWNDEANWAPGLPGTITRRFARLARNGGGLAVSQVQRAPTIALGRSGGLFAGEGERTLFAGWGIVGRGNPVTAGALFATNGSILPNPNQEPLFRASGWDPRQTMPLFTPRLAQDGPVAAAFSRGFFLVAARGAGDPDTPGARRILGSRISAEGVRLDGPDDWPVLHEDTMPVANPFLVAGGQAFLLLFERDQGPGRYRAWARLIRVE